jgi:hypothetical protein
MEWWRVAAMRNGPFPTPHYSITPFSELVFLADPPSLRFGETCERENPERWHCESRAQLGSATQT